MDVNAVTNTTINTSAAHITGITHDTDRVLQTRLSNAVEEPSMMDLEDVQNFLYMMIGSDILVEARTNNLGASFDQLA